MSLDHLDEDFGTFGHGRFGEGLFGRGGGQVPDTAVQERRQQPSPVAVERRQQQPQVAVERRQRPVSRPGGEN